MLFFILWFYNDSNLWSHNLFTSLYWINKIYLFYMTVCMYVINCMFTDFFKKMLIFLTHFLLATEVSSTPKYWIWNFEFRKRSANHNRHFNLFMSLKQRFSKFCWLSANLGSQHMIEGRTEKIHTDKPRWNCYICALLVTGFVIGLIMADYISPISLPH